MVSEMVAEIVLSFVMGGFFLAGATFDSEKLKASPTIAGVVVGIASIVVTKIFCNFIL